MKKQQTDQIKLRREFCLSHGTAIYPEIERFVVLGFGLVPQMLAHQECECGRATLHVRSATWSQIAEIATHPMAEEVRRYLRWKIEHSRGLDHLGGGAEA